MRTDEQRRLFQQLMEQHKGILFKIAKTYCQNEDDRQDLIQEIMVQVWQSFDKYDNKFAVTTWLYRISLNVAISFYRKNFVRKGYFITLTDQASQIPHSENTDEELRLNMLEHFISELKEVDKALMLLYLDDKSHAEIADILGISITNVATKIGRIKEKLKQKFSQTNF